jgi:hypothetical protein
MNFKLTSLFMLQEIINIAFLSSIIQQTIFLQKSFFSKNLNSCLSFSKTVFASIR